MIARFLGGNDPMVPEFGLPAADMSDVSAAHLAALRTPASIGQRYIAADRFLRLPEVAQILKAACPDRRIATRAAPCALVRLPTLCGPEIRVIVPRLGWAPQLDTAKVRRELGLAITPTCQSILATARFLTETAHQAA